MVLGPQRVVDGWNLPSVRFYLCLIRALSEWLSRGADLHAPRLFKPQLTKGMTPYEKLLA